MVIFLTVVHVFVCLFLIGVVLMQSGKAADLAAAFGGQGSQTAFGPRAAATMLSKITTICAGGFMVTSLTLAILATRTGGASSGTVLEKTKIAAPPAAAAPATPPAPKPAIEMVDEQGNVVRRQEIKIPENVKKDGKPVPMEFGKELPVEKTPAKK